MSKCVAWTDPLPVKDPVTGKPTTRKLSCIDRLFNRFDGMYMQRWKSNFTSAHAVENWKESWADGLTRNRITPEMAFEGIIRCETICPEWPPVLPQFLEMCRASMNFEAAFKEATAQIHIRHNGGEDHWSHPAIYWAAVEFGAHDLRSIGYKEAAKRWATILGGLLERGCDPVPAFAFQLAAPARDADGVAISSVDAKQRLHDAIEETRTRKPAMAIAVRRAKQNIARHEAGEPVTRTVLEHSRFVMSQASKKDVELYPINTSQEFHES